jgi:hypothetical protein
MKRLRRLRTAVGGCDGPRGKFQRTPLIGVGVVRHGCRLGTTRLVDSQEARLTSVLAAGVASLFLNIQVKQVRRPTGWVGEMTRIHRQRKADDFL